MVPALVVCSQCTYVYWCLVCMCTDVRCVCVLMSAGVCVYQVCVNTVVIAIVPGK